jgi:hypothetical protein
MSYYDPEEESVYGIYQAEQETCQYKIERNLICGQPVVKGFKYCYEHNGKRCHICQNPATHVCDEDYCDVDICDGDYCHYEHGHRQKHFKTIWE